MGLHIDDLPSRALSWRDLKVVVACAPKDSALSLARDPKAARSLELDLLRSVEYSARWLMWSKSRDGSNNRNIPEVWRFPWEPVQVGVFDSDVMPADEMAARLGWKVG